MNKNSKIIDVSELKILGYLDNNENNDTYISLGDLVKAINQTPSVNAVCQEAYDTLCDEYSNLKEEFDIIKTERDILIAILHQIYFK